MNDVHYPGTPALEPLRALEWNLSGKSVVLVPTASRSVAYDIADNGAIVGMLQMSDGRHYAFRYHNGHAERLDDLPHPAGWRFESAFAVAANGTIVGIGTRNGTPMIFSWCDSNQTTGRVQPTTSDLR